jgi:hypothetical protein
VAYRYSHPYPDNRFPYFPLIETRSGRHLTPQKDLPMKSILMSAAFALALAAGLTAPIQAAGCLKGAAIGGLAGHFAGHHGLLGAGAGCVIGRHEANKHARERAEHDPASGNSSDPGYTGPDATSRQH